MGATLRAKFDAYSRLGLRSIARVASYRVGIKTGLHPVLRISASIPKGPFFRDFVGEVAASAEARFDWIDTGPWFGHHRIVIDNFPDWHLNPLTGNRADNEAPWHRISDFDPALGDIKAIWEASRFDWLISMSQRVAKGDSDELDRLNAWISNWLHENPPYRGVNWKCGQEASVRVLHIALAALLLGQAENPREALCDLVELHLQRIAPTMGYALGQDNNHGTSEAAALFVGGSFLASAGRPAGSKWMVEGRHWLEDRAVKLFAADGGFSQHSLVYHRMALDTYSFVEVWRNRLSLPEFSRTLYERMRAAAHWLRQFVDPTDGDGPNYGANDGAHILNIAGCGYRDFRPSLQLASVLFSGARALPADGPWNRQLVWLGVDLPDRGLPALGSETFPDSGMHVLRSGRAVAYFRFPRFRFRPSQSDALHVDLWVDGANILRDAGTYSYNADFEDLEYFGGTASHNTVQFHNRDQMPRVGRFLFSDWLKTSSCEAVSEDAGAVTAMAAYLDSRGAEHKRTLRLSPRSLACLDELSGKAKKAILRWRLEPGEWRIDGTTVIGREVTLSFEQSPSAPLPVLRDEAESRYYLAKTKVPVITVATSAPTQITTTIAFL